MINKDKNYAGLPLTIGLVFLFISIIVLREPKTESYIFDFDVEGNKNGNVTHLGCFSLNYDFSSNNGAISFLVENDTYFDRIKIEFPKAIKNVGYVMQPDENIVKEIKNKNTQIDFSNFSQNIERYNITTYFESDLIPNAYFQIFSRPNKLTLSAGCGPAATLTLGARYNCIGRCLIPINGVEEDSLSSQNELRLDFTDENYHTIDNHRFKIEAMDEYNRMWKELLFGLSVSFIAAGLGFLIK